MIEESRNKINSFYRQASIPLIATVCLALGTLLGLLISTYQFPNQEVSLAAKKYESVLHLIDKEYVDSVGIQKLFESNLEKTLSELDPHSSYVAAEDFHTKTSLDSDFDGIGIRYLYLRDTLLVTEAMKGGPSDLAGLRAGDRLIEVSDSSVVALPNTNTIYKLLRGERNTKVKVKIYRKATNQTLDLEIIRGAIPNLAADVAYLLDARTAYVRLNRFSANSHLEVINKVQELKLLGAKRLVLDLRDNGGGYLHAAIEICDEFLAPGRDILYTVKRGKITMVEKAVKSGGTERMPLVILINENSASASEIVAGALQDNDRALIVGRRSFGKGLVQTPFVLLDNSELRLTTSRYHTPSGRCIQKSYDAYQGEYLNRLQSGELFSEENLQKNDSLKYHTLNNRTVYGGGGIYPDVFVAQDTSDYSVLLSELYRQQAFLEFGILYALRHPDLKNQVSLEQFSSGFELSSSEWRKFRQFSGQLGIKWSNQGVMVSGIKIKQEIKVHIAEAIWGNEGMSYVWSRYDPYIIAAIKSFEVLEETLARKP